MKYSSPVLFILFAIIIGIGYVRDYLDLFQILCLCLLNLMLLMISFIYDKLTDKD